MAVDTGLIILYVNLTGLIILFIAAIACIVLDLRLKTQRNILTTVLQIIVAALIVPSISICMSMILSYRC